MPVIWRSWSANSERTRAPRLALHAGGVDALALGELAAVVGVLEPQAEVGVLQRARRAWSRGPSACTLSLSMPPILAKMRSDCLRWLSAIEKPPSTEATPSITPRAWRMERRDCPDLHPGLVEASAECT
jgi:hypothetical protein